MYFSNYTRPPNALTVNIDPTHFYRITDNFNSLSCSEFSSKSYLSKIKKTLFLKENQLFCTTATKEILPSATFDESDVDTFALYVLLTNVCS